MNSKLLGKDGRHIAHPLMTELSEYAGRCALTSKGEIDAIDEIGINGNGIADDIDPTNHTIKSRTFFPVQR